MPFPRLLARALLVIAFVHLATPAPSSAQEDQSLQRARLAMERGQEQFLSGDYLGAATSFMAAYDEKPFGAFLYNAGLAFERHGQLQRAIRLYQRFLEEEPEANDAGEVRQRVERLRAAIQAAVAEQAGPPDETPGTGETAGTETGENAVAGENAVTGETATGETGGETGEAGEATEATVAPPADVPAPVMKSLLSVETRPNDARITVRRDGEVVARGPSPFAETLDEGEYEVSVEHADYRTVSRTMQIRPGKVYVAILEMSQGAFLGFLRVHSDPPGANVFIDDREAGAVGQTPFQAPLPTGAHRIWVERPGFDTVEREVEVEIGSDDVQEIALERVSSGRVRITANVAGATVSVNGEEVGQVPYEGEVPPGDPEITIEADGMKDWEERVRVERGQVTPIRVEFNPSVPRSGAWVSLILGLAAAGGGTALYFAAEGVADDLRADQVAGRLADDDSRIMRGKVFAASAYAGWGLGGLFGIISFYLFVRDPLPDTEGRVFEPRDWTFAPVIDGQRAGASLRGTF
tara:strand:- start:725 stop:2293 length:1569 start_codon:yes stop_codon:yes gene_type:complete